MTELDRRGGPPSLWRLAGPGLLVAATGIGSGDVVAATVGGARFGVILLWAVALGAFLKFVVNEGVARWQLATGMTALEGWAAHLPRWVNVYFVIYLLLWTVAVSAALTNATGLGIENLTGGAVSRSWGAVAHSFIGFAFVMLGGYGSFERLMKTLVGIMGVSILMCAVLTFDNAGASLQGLLVPTIPEGGGRYVLSLVGGIGGSITMLSYGYWMREEGMSGAGYVRYVRADVGIAYLFTAVFAIALMLLANQAFFVPGVSISDAEAVPRMAATLGETLGPLGWYAYSLGFWAAVFVSLLGVWQSVPYMYADLYGIFRKVPAAERAAIIRVTSTPYRLALAFITLAPLPFAFVSRPLFIIVAYTIVGSLFVPFLAATLLYLNNKVAWTSAVPRNGRMVNGLLVVILSLFLWIGALEMLQGLG